MLSVALMAHPKRRRFIDTLARKLPEAEIVLDRHDDRWETGRRALLAFDPAASHHFVIQDDAICSRNLLAAVEKAVRFAPDQPVSLYTGAVRPYQQVVAPAVAEAVALGTPWIEMEGPIWGVGLVIPTAHIPELVAWCDRRNLPNYDLRIASWYRNVTKRLCRYTVPSLVDHRPADENPSLVAGRDGNRRALRFIGENRSGLRLRWEREPVDARAVACFRNPGTKRRVRVRRGTRRYEQLHASSGWVLERAG